MYPLCRTAVREGWRRQATHRTAEPPYYHAPQGVCRLCGDPILRPEGSVNRNRRWHLLCTTWWDITVHRDCTIRAWRLIHSPKEQRESVSGPRGGKQPNYGVWTHVALHGLVPCSRCGVGLHHGEIEVDHIVELIDGGEHAFGNLQPLCHDCHARKSAASRRARLRPVDEMQEALPL
jgi:HNH endonuclease